jgi:hypothetical protein
MPTVSLDQATMLALFTQWGVRVELNHGPASADGERIVRDEWSKPVVYDADSRRDAENHARCLRAEPMIYRNVTLVRRSVTQWVDA